jgi:hypothetical protein
MEHALVIACYSLGSNDGACLDTRGIPYVRRITKDSERCDHICLRIGSKHIVLVTHLLLRALPHYSRKGPGDISLGLVYSSYVSHCQKAMQSRWCGILMTCSERKSSPPI